MKNYLCKHLMPWRARNCFDSEESFSGWLERCRKRLTDCRMVLVLLAALPLIVGYMLDQHAIMLLAIVPLSLVLLFSMALDRIENALDGQNKTNE